MLRAETLKEAKQNPSLSGITGREKEPKGFRAVPWGGGEGSQKPHRGAAGAGVWGLEPCRWPTSDVLSLLLGGASHHQRAWPVFARAAVKGDLGRTGTTLGEGIPRD